MNGSHNHSPTVADAMETHIGRSVDVTEVEPTLVSSWNERTLEVVRARPILCLTGALVVGFVVGKIAARY